MKAEVRYGDLKASDIERFKDAATSAAGRHREEPHDGYLIEIDTTRFSTPEMGALIPLLEKAGSGREARAMKAMMSYTDGDFEKTVPSFPAFPKGLKEFLNAKAIRGWLFVRRGKTLYPYAVSSIYVHTPARNDRDDKPLCRLTLEAFGPNMDSYRSSSRFGKVTFTHSWEPSDVTRKSIPDILLSAGLIPETEELLAEHDAAVELFNSDMKHRFAEQVVIDGEGYDADDLPPGGVRKAIHDLKMTEQSDPPAAVDSKVLDRDVDMPLHPCIYTFDLSSHTFHWHHVTKIKPYVFDPTLRDKLVLPQSHRDLLDVLTSDLSVFSGDIIQGKSAGNIIICQGLPGLGKTLTAEVYSELTETPIYAVHSGTMGTTPTEVEKSLKVIFKRQRRWGCLVLLDEADVFVKSRGDNLIQNAIVAEFLRTLEYFEGLMFMTTNRPDDIDDAIISRAAAIITYRPPSETHARRIWRVMFDQNKVKPPAGLIDELVAMFPRIAPRDIKMLLRLVLRVSTSQEIELTPNLFRRIAMFRVIEIADRPDDLEPSENLI